jgi:hypothetical protein
MEGKLGFSVRYFAGLLFAGILLSCTSVTLYSVDLRYKPSKPAEGREGGGKPVLLVGAFADARKIDDKLVVGAVVQDDGSRIPVVPKYARPADAVTAMVKDYLSRSGYTVLSAAQTAKGKQEVPAKKMGEVMVGGEINELDVLCRQSIPLKKYTAKVKLTVVLSDAKTGAIFYTVSAESNSSLEHYRFSEEMLAEQINDALSDAVEKLFEGDEMRRRIYEAAGRAS